MRFSADGTHLAIHVTDLVANPSPTTPPTIERDFVRVVEFPGGKTLSEMPLGEHTTMRVDLSADGQLIALGDIEQRVSLCDTSTGHVKLTFAPALATQVISIAVSPDGRYAAASDLEPGDLFIWETEHGDLLRRIDGQEFEKRGSRRHAHGAMRFSPDGKFLADGRSDATFVIEIATGAIEASLREDAAAIQWSADSELVTLVGSAAVHDHETGGSPGMDNSYPSIRIWDWRAGTVERR